MTTEESATTGTTTIFDMGTQRMYLESGGFTEYLYHQDGDTIVASNGVEGKVVTKIDKTSFDGLPTMSNTSEVYLKKDKTGEIIQARIYKDRKPVFDLDWNHEHTNKNGEQFEKGTVHVQEFVKNKKGDWERDYKHARYMTDSEIERYGELIRMINPKIKLRK